MKRHPLATLLLTLVTVLVFVLLYGPIFIPIVTSFFTVKYGAVDWSQMNLDAYAKLTVLILRSIAVVAIPAHCERRCYASGYLRRIPEKRNHIFARSYGRAVWHPCR